jgi:RNA polymerase sigma-70 factor (ECF subfamily)
VVTTLVAEDTLQTPKEVSDETLLTKICADDRDALALLFRRYARLVSVVGRRILRSEAEAEDLVQEVFLSVHRCCKAYNSSKSSVRSWIVHISYRRAFDRRRYLVSRDFYGEVALEGSGAGELPTPASAAYEDSLEGVFGCEGWKRLRGTLTDDQWEAIRLHFYEGYTLPEIGAKLGWPHKRVRRHFYRGLEKLRKHNLQSEWQKC